MDDMEKLVKKHNLLRKNDTNEIVIVARIILVYSAEVLIGNNQQGDKCFGICETEFKTRLGNHKKLFKNKEKRH